MAQHNKAGGTTFTTPSDLEVVATRTFAAPRALVWDCWTKPEHLAQWMLGPDGWSMPVCESDLRPGGAWRYVWENTDGQRMEMTGTHREVTPPERLVQTERWGADWPETINTLMLTEKDGMTQVTCTILYPSKEARDAAMATGMADGWSLSNNRLDAHLRRQM